MYVIGDLSRFRMAIEPDREVWCNVARFWFKKASDRSPQEGRLYHHLAAVTRPSKTILPKISLYTKSLTCVTPFTEARGVTKTLFNGNPTGKDLPQRRPSSFEMVFLKAHGVLFTSHSPDSTEEFDAMIEAPRADGLLGTYI